MLRCALRLLCPAGGELRKELVERLTDEVFSRGNQILKRVYASVDELPEGVQSFPEVCFIGRPNSGKSSVVAALLRNKQMVRPGVTPGNTDRLGFFNVGDALLLVDTPGWGAWRQREFSTFHQARALSLTRQYIALRNGRNLQHVYWTMAITPSGIRFGPREEELFEFLAHERVRFTVLMTKIDRVNFSEARLNHEANAVFDFFGSRDVPILEVCADPFATGRAVNIERLRCDIVGHCTSALPTEKLTLKDMRHELSYLPPSAVEKQRVEERYPLEAHIMPVDNRMDMADLVAEHNREKAALLQDMDSGMASLPLNSAEAAEVLNPMDSRITSGPLAPHPDHVASVVGVPIPKSMVPLSVVDKMAKLEGTLAHYREFIEAPYAEVAASDEHFLQRTGGGDLDADDDAARGQSEWKRKHKEIRKRFVDLKRKPRSMYLHSGVLCPWLADEGRGGVQGLEAAAPAAGTNSGRVAGLKAKGFGGKSHSPKTLRNKGRSTLKVHRWAT